MGAAPKNGELNALDFVTGRFHDPGYIHTKLAISLDLTMARNRRYGGGLDSERRMEVIDLQYINNNCLIKSDQTIMRNRLVIRLLHSTHQGGSIDLFQLLGNNGNP